MSRVTVMDHPLIQHKIGIIRRKEVGSKDFRQMISEIAMLMCYEATRNLKLQDVEIETPICTTQVKELRGKKLAVVPILRAGLGGSAVEAIRMLKNKGVKNIRFMCIIAAPEGVKRMQEAHPDVDVYIGALDEHLNDHGYIVPGLGDAGDRIFGTK